jgi:TonB family protein
MNRTILFSCIGHLLAVTIVFLFGRSRPEAAPERVYSVSVVPGGGGSGRPGSGGKAEVGVQGMTGSPGKIGGSALPAAGKPKGTAVVEEARKGRKQLAPRDSNPAARGNDQIVMRVYGSGGTIGGGGAIGPGGPGLGTGTGRPASAYEIAMNSKILANWNEDLWKALPDRLTATIQFAIAADGSVSNVRVFAASGNAGFDLAARRAIELARMPAPADFGFPGDRHEARVTFLNRPE